MTKKNYFFSLVMSANYRLSACIHENINRSCVNLMKMPSLPFFENVLKSSTCGQIGFPRVHDLLLRTYFVFLLSLRKVPFSYLSFLSRLFKLFSFFKALFTACTHFTMTFYHSIARVLNLTEFTPYMCPQKIICHLITRCVEFLSK